MRPSLFEKLRPAPRGADGVDRSEKIFERTSAVYLIFKTDPKDIAPLMLKDTARRTYIIIGISLDILILIFSPLKDGAKGRSSTVRQLSCISWGIT